MAQNYGLGRGLSSLIPQKRSALSASEAEKKISEPDKNFNYFGAGARPVVADGAKNKEGVLEVDINRIVPNPHQPRIHFDETKLQELSQSIKEHGIIQPLVVTRIKDLYEIIAGERRFQASKLAGLTKIPVIVREATEQQKFELAIIENIQRHDLSSIEEAASYKKLIEEFDLTQEEVADKLGKSRSAVANKIRLLSLPMEIQKALVENKITEGHCKLLLAISNPEKQRAFYEVIIKNNLTVRQTENKVAEVSVRPHKRSLAVDPEAKRVEDELSQKLGTKVKLAKSGKGGKILIEYYSEEELASIMDKINK